MPQRSTVLSPRARALQLAATAATALAASACDIPTAAPKWDTEWGLAAKTDSITVAEFLPADITVVNGAFYAAPSPATSTIRLSELCGGSCPAVSIPKPSFSTQLNTDVNVAGELLRATVAPGNALRVRVRQDFGFDLLAPAGATTAGALALRVLTRGGTATSWDTLTTSSLTGAAARLPSGETVTIPLPLPEGRTIGRLLRLEVSITSPAGNPVQLNGARALDVTLDVPGGIRASAATLDFSARTVNTDGGSLDLSELDFGSDKLRSASLRLTIDNPVAVVGDATLVLSRGGAAVLTKAFPIAAAQSSPVVTFSSEELQLLRGAEHALEIRANVRASNTNREVTFRPSDVLRVRSAFQATIRPTGSPSNGQ